jgi:hypothetical protein
MREELLSRTLILVVLLLVPELALTQSLEQSTTLTINGHAGKAPVIQIDGKSFVEVEALARLTNGSISFKANQITLTLPISSSGTTPQGDPEAKSGVSREFLKAAIEEITVIREWRIAVLNAVQHNVPVTEDWVGGYRRAAESKLALVSAALATDSDGNTLPLISNEFANMQKLSDRYLAMHKSMAYVSSDSLENDPLDQQIVSCARSLASVAADGQFLDIATCH